MQPNPKGRGWDIVRSEPTVVSAELSQPEAEALVFALNAQTAILEARSK